MPKVRHEVCFEISAVPCLQFMFTTMLALQTPYYFNLPAAMCVHVALALSEYKMVYKHVCSCEYPSSVKNICTCIGI